GDRRRTGCPSQSRSDTEGSLELRENGVRLILPAGDKVRPGQSRGTQGTVSGNLRPDRVRSQAPGERAHRQQCTLAASASRGGGEEVTATLIPRGKQRESTAVVLQV